jgi:excisionase family DNA binding protein
MRDYYTIHEVSLLFAVSPKTVRRWIATGNCVAIRLPGSRLIRVDVSSLHLISEPVQRKWVI